MKKQSSVRYIYIFFISALFLSVSGCLISDAIDDMREPSYKSNIPVSQPLKISTQKESIEMTNEETKPTETEKIINNPVADIDIPKEFNLDMVFFPQSPYGNWGLPYQESCEEASLLLANYFITGQKPDIEKFHQDLLDLIEWEKEYFGQYFHTTVAETAEIADQYFGLKNYKIVENPTVEEMKQYIAQGFPIIVPTSGRVLGNPFFSGNDPFYHMLVVRGYDESHFITNDVGTKRGENFIYKYNVLINAMHDLVPEVFDNPGTIVNGPKRILVIMPNSAVAGVDAEKVLTE